MAYYLCYRLDSQFDSALFRSEISEAGAGGVHLFDDAAMVATIVDRDSQNDLGKIMKKPLLAFYDKNKFGWFISFKLDPKLYDRKTLTSIVRFWRNRNLKIGVYQP